MHYSHELRRLAAGGLLGLTGASACLAGWGHSHIVGGGPNPPIAPGSLSNQIWRAQEHNAEASDFVIYEHEFQMYDCAAVEKTLEAYKGLKCDGPLVGGGIRLNYAGEDHVKQIAARLHGGAPFPVVIERSRHSKRLSDVYKFPVHLNPKLDMLRRDVVVQAMLAMGIQNAEEVVVVSPAFAEGLTSPEAERAYLRGINPYAFGSFGSRGAGRSSGFGF